MNPKKQSLLKAWPERQGRIWSAPLVRGALAKRFVMARGSLLSGFWQFIMRLHIFVAGVCFTTPDYGQSTARPVSTDLWVCQLCRCLLSACKLRKARGLNNSAWAWLSCLFSLYFQKRRLYDTELSDQWNLVNRLGFPDISFIQQRLPHWRSVTTFNFATLTFKVALLIVMQMLPAVVALFWQHCWLVWRVTAACTAHAHYTSVPCALACQGFSEQLFLKLPRRPAVAGHVQPWPSHALRDVAFSMASHSVAALSLRDLL